MLVNTQFNCLAIFIFNFLFRVFAAYFFTLANK